MASTLVIQEWLAFLGRQAKPNEPGSPYLIAYRSDPSDSSGVKPLNSTIYSCGDPSLGCSCGDCPSSSVCTGSLLPQLNTETSCSVKMGSLKVGTILLPELTIKFHQEWVQYTKLYIYCTTSVLKLMMFRTS